MLRGLATVSFYAEDVAAAASWYAEFLGIEPYFERPGYREFRIGDFQHELGLIDAQYRPAGPASGPAGEIVYWHVDDLALAVQKLTAMGAKEYDPPRERGHGFVTASMIDPFGNLLGVMTNPHYLDVLAATRPLVEAN